MRDVFAADGDMAQVPVFWVHPIGRSPQANAGFRKLDERGASVAKQEDLLIGKDRGLPGGD